MQPQGHRVESLLRRVAADGDGMAGVCAQTVELWREVGALLVPVIGQRGMCALYERALHLAAARHPWLDLARDDSAQTPAFAKLADALLQQPQDDAITAIVTLFDTFDRLLVTLIGASLCERLLQPIRDVPSAGPTRQDTAT